jgi:protein-S-isoprenylcysteine O-methyltransferase Ste14
VGNVLTPTRLDAPARGSLGPAIAINLLLLSVFAAQHSIMARPWFKRWWTRLVPETAERSTYVLCSSLALIALFLFWQPMGGVVWDLQHPVARAAAQAVFVAGWLTVLVSTFLLDHFDLFGLRQAWLHFRGRPYAPLPFRTPGPYRIVRHPLYVGWLLAFWATPTMTFAHLLFALVTTAYILVAIRWEERDLVAAHPEYALHRERVPMLVPRLLRALDLRGARGAPTAGRPASEPAAARSVADPAAAWLHAPCLHRYIGIEGTDDQFVELSPAALFDGILYVQDTTPTTPLGN